MSASVPVTVLVSWSGASTIDSQSQRRLAHMGTTERMAALLLASVVPAAALAQLLEREWDPGRAPGTLEAAVGDRLMRACAELVEVSALIQAMGGHAQGDGN